MSTRPETKQSLNMLFAAKWNIPKAAQNANLTNKEMKIIFNEYCVLNPPTYVPEEQVALEPATEADQPLQ